MSKEMTYTLRNSNVQALRLTNDTKWSQVFSFCEPDAIHIDGRFGASYCSVVIGTTSASMGDYLVRTAKGKLAVYSPRCFEDLYATLEEAQESL